MVLRPRLALLLLVVAAAGAAAAEVGLRGREAEEFLRTARVVEMRELGTGVTRPQKATLSTGGRTAHAVWKTHDEFAPVKRFYDGNLPDFGFRDTYKSEVAAYELDKLLHLGMVPPTVERRIGRDRGSLQLWIEDTITEAERLARGLEPRDPLRWNRQMYTVRIWHQLIDDRDFNNVSNLLVAPDFRLHIIDSSRAFRLAEELRAPGELELFPRALLTNLRALRFDLLQERLGRWLTKKQIRTLLVRRDLILARAAELVAERGEERVLFP